MAYVSQWIIYFCIPQKGNVWTTLRNYVNYNVGKYLDNSRCSPGQLAKIRDKAKATKSTVGILLSLSGVIISFLLLTEFDKSCVVKSYEGIYLETMALAILIALAFLFVSLEALDTAINPFFDDPSRLNELRKLYNRGCKFYLRGLAAFTFALLCGLAILLPALVAFVGILFFIVCMLCHNYRQV